MSSSTQQNKSRNLSPLQYLEKLKAEWWVVNLRRKIYPAKEDKRRFSKIGDLKKARIIEICERNDLPCIFTDKEAMRELNKSFTKGGGIPVFEGVNELDELNYYSPGSDVRCFYGFDDNDKAVIRVGRIVSYSYHNKEVVVRIEDNEAETLSFEKVTRVF